MPKEEKECKFNQTERIIWNAAVDYLNSWGMVDAKVLSDITGISLEHTEAALEGISKKEKGITLGRSAGIPTVLQAA